MSIELMLLTGFMAAVAALTIVKPVYVFEYPVAAATLMCVFLLPQAWYIERQGGMADFQPTLTWSYMILCMAATIVGYLVGRNRKVTVHQNMANEIGQRYDLDRLFVCCLGLSLIGFGAVILINRELAHMDVGERWTGPIAFYAMVSGLLLYGAVISWIIFLYFKQLRFLVIAAFGLLAMLQTVLFSARREGAFTLAVIVILGFYFVRKRMVGRLILIPLILVGALFINQAGAIRGYIANNNATVIGALSSEEIISQGTTTQATEVSSGVSDIAIASWSGEYQFFRPFYNRIIGLYVPAFILGREVKDGLIAESGEDEGGATRYFADGSTRTGFADTFQSLHFFGCLIFFAIAYFMGRLWRRATTGDLRAQIYYMLMLSAALKVLTESAASFTGVLPLIFATVGTAFMLSRKPQPRQSTVPSFAMPSYRDRDR